MTKGKYIRTEEIKKRNSESRKGKGIGICGKYKRTEEIKNKQSTKMKGHPISELQKQILSKIMSSPRNPMYRPEVREKQLKATNTKEFKESHSAAIKGDKNPMKNPDTAKKCKGFKECHHTEETKVILSQKKIEFYKIHPEEKRNGEKSNFYGKKGKQSLRYGKQTPHGHKSYLHKTPLQGTILMHNWDELYATYLDSVNIPYYYEYKAFPMDINNKSTTYTPDFFLPNTNEYIEIKGYFRGDAKDKYEKFKETYPNIKISLLMKKDLENLGIKIRKYQKKEIIVKSLFDF